MLRLICFPPAGAGATFFRSFKYLSPPHLTIEPVELPGETYRAKATVVDRAERDRLYAAHAELMPGFAEYEAKTDRVIPVIVLERI